MLHSRSLAKIRFCATSLGVKARHTSYPTAEKSAKSEWLTYAKHMSLPHVCAWCSALPAPAGDLAYRSLRSAPTSACVSCFCTLHSLHSPRKDKHAKKEVRCSACV